MSKDTPHDMKLSGEKGSYYCSGCDPECDKEYALPGKCSICAQPLTIKPGVDPELLYRTKNKPGVDPELGPVVDPEIKYKTKNKSGVDPQI